MEEWRRNLAECLTSPDELAARFALDKNVLRKVTARFPMRITPYYLGLIKEVGDPIWRQCVPDVRELEDLEQVPDPLCEEELSPVPGLIHRYPDRVVWLVSSVCALYCRFCMRKRYVGCAGSDGGSFSTDAVLDYITAHPEIRDVILSGGDPLLLDDDVLDTILARLRRISHVEIIRIGTRVPVTLPERITPKLCKILSRYQPLYVNTHFNHPAEITPESSTACGRLADAGIPLSNQTVLLAGVNDDQQVMKRLLQLLLTIRVRPYYIHQMDLVKGTAHFRVKLQQGIDIVAGLRGHTSGLATPYYMVDLPGGKGKVPVLPDCVQRNGNTWLLRNYLGEVVEYVDQY
jgi:lysine 2,3-aminomutase